MKRSLVVLVLCLLVSSAYATNGTRMIGFDARTVGRGGTTIGIFDNTSLMATNPAGISFLSGSALDANFSLMVPTTKFSNSLNNKTGETNYFPIPDIAYVNRQRENPLTWGIGAFTQGGMGADFTLNHDLFREQSGSFIPQKYHSKLAVMQGGPSVAYAITPEFSVGASAHLVFSMLEFQMPYSLSPAIMKGVVNPANGMTFGDMFAGPPAQGGFGYTEVTAAAKMSDLTAFGFAGKVGIAWKPNEKATFGLSYTSPSALTYKKGKAGMDMTAQLNNAFGKAMQGYMMQNPTATVPQAQAAVMQQFGQLGIDMSKGVVANYDLDVNLKFPQSIALGAGIRLSEELLVGLDFEWINWKNAFDKMTLNLSNGSNSNINRMLGNAGNFSLDFPMNWEDAYCVRLGAEVAAGKALTLRAGGAFGSNPVVNETVFPVFPAIVENHVMVGASYQVSEPITVHVAYEHALNNSQSSPGDNLVAEEFSGSTSQLSENIFHLSFTWGL